jgi:GAF domain-containing protein
VLTRNQELRTLNRISELTTQAQGVSDIWSKALGESLVMIPAQGAGLYLLQEDEYGSLVLKYQENTFGLPQSVNLEQGRDPPFAICRGRRWPGQSAGLQR